MEIRNLVRNSEIPEARPAKAQGVGDTFAKSLRDAISDVNELQRASEAEQRALASGQPVELHDVLIKVQEADLAFKTMMEVRSKLLTAYNEIMRIGGGG